MHQKSRIIGKFSGIAAFIFLFFLASFFLTLENNTSYAFQEGRVTNTQANTPETKTNTSTTTTSTNTSKTAAEQKENPEIQSLKDCIAAQTGGEGNPVDVCYANPNNMKRKADLREWGQFSSQENVGGLLQGILRFFMGIVGGLALLAIMIGGGMIMLGGTDETMLERGKDILKYTAIGVAIVLLAVTITTLAQTLFYSVDV